MHAHVGLANMLVIAPTLPGKLPSKALQPRQPGSMNVALQIAIKRYRLFHRPNGITNMYGFQRRNYVGPTLLGRAPSTSGQY